MVFMKISANRLERDEESAMSINMSINLMGISHGLRACTRRSALFAIVSAALVLLCLCPPADRKAEAFSFMAKGAEGGSGARHDAINRLIEKEYRLQPDGSWTMRLHFVTQVLTFNGMKENSDFRFRYNPAFEEVKVLLARTATAHGRVVDANPKEINDIPDPGTSRASLFASSRIKVVNFPAVDLGSTVELVLEKRSRLPFWALESFRLDDPTLVKQVRVQVPEGMELKHFTDHPGITLDVRPAADNPGATEYVWTGKDLLSAWKEPHSPHLLNSGHCLVLATASDWLNATALLRDRLLRKGWKELEVNLYGYPDTPEGLFSALQEQIKAFRVPLFKTALRFQEPEKTLSSRMGTQFDACILFMAILRQKGHSPRLILANSRGAFLDRLESVPAAGLLDTAVVECCGRFFSFDSRNMPPGVTDMDGQLGLDLETGRWLTIEDHPKAQTSSAWQVELRSQRLAAVRYFRSDSGAESRTMRAIFRDLTPEEFDVRKRMFLFALSPSVREGGHLWVNGEEDLRSPVTVRADFELDAPLIQLKDGSLLYPVRFGQILESLGSLPRKRHNPFFLAQGQTARFVLELTIPPGWRVRSMPASDSGRQGLFSWRISSTKTGRRVYVSACFQTDRGILAVEDYQAFRQALGRVLDPSRWMVVLDR